jgi:2-polyprenyl-3-methyl-5-hydroxy-6-metoxy-1,4-benzoquinol methylase
VDRKDWDRRYQGQPLLWSAEPNRFLVEEVEGLPPGRVLDLGAGEGRNSVWLAECGWRVTAVEFSGIAIDRARRIATARRVEVCWVQADLLEWQPPSASFDLVLMLYLHLPQRDLATVVGRAASAVAPGGTLLVIGHDRSNLEHGHGGPQDPTVLYSADELVDLLPGFELLEAAHRGRPVETDDGTVQAIDCLVRARSRH